MDRALSLLSFSSPLKRFYKFLLKRILGSFLQYDLDLEQLDVQLAKGELQLRDLELNVQMLNELCVDLPITFIRARIRSVRATIPWRNLLTKSCLLQLDGWELVVVPSEQVQTKASTSFSAMLAQSVMAVDVDQNDIELQKSLASLGQHFRAREQRQASGQQTPMSMSGASSASGSMAFGAHAARHRDAMEEAEEAHHEAMTAAAVRAREKRRKQAEQRRLRREQLGEEDEDAAEDSDPSATGGVHVESDVNTDDDGAEEAHSVRKHSVRQAAALDTANAGLQVVASFLEQVVSAIELEVTDVTIRVQHQPKLGHKQTNLVVRLPWVKFSDLNKEAQQKEEQSREEDRRELEARAQLAQERRLAARQRREAERQRRRADRAARRAAAAASGDGAVEDEEDESDPDADAHFEDAEAEEAEDEAAIRREMELKIARDAAGSSGSIHLHGPKFSYHKAIRFHGFRVELAEDACIDSSIAQFHSSTATATPATGLMANLHEADPNNLDVSDHSQAAAAEPQTIISGSMDQECIITLKLKMQDTLANEPRLESTCFIQSLRALLTPRQLALLTDLAGAIGLSAKQVAINAQLAHQSALLQPQPPIVLNAAGGFSPSVPAAASLGKSAVSPGRAHGSAHPRSDPSLGRAIPLGNPDYHVIENLLNQQSGGAGGSAALSSEDRFFDLSEGGHSGSGPDAAHSQSADQVLNMWSMETHILHCSLTLMESDEQSWATDWWSTATGDVSTFAGSGAGAGSGLHSPQPEAIVQSVIPNITCNHLFLSVHHTFININQTSAESTVKVALGSLQLNEFLVQQRARPRQHGQLPSRMQPRAADDEWIGFKARPLISFTAPASDPHPSEFEYPGTPADTFLRSTRPVSEPHLSVELRTSVDSGHSLSFNEPIAQFFEPHDNATVGSRITLSCQPATIHLDLGLGERLKHMLDAVTTPAVYLHGGLSQPGSSSSSSEHASFTFDLHRINSAAQPMGGEELLDRINANQRRHSLGGGGGGGGEARSSDASSYSQTVVIAPTIHLNVYFPATTPSQLQPHPYSRFELMTQDPYIDARGILRPERIELELHDVSIANECEVANGAAHDHPHDLRQSVLSNAQLQDAEWLIRFHHAGVFLHFPSLDGVSADDSLEDLEWLSKRLLTTSYPMAQPISASSAYHSYAAAASYISILTRAPMPHSNSMQFQPAHADDHTTQGSPSLDGSSTRSVDEADRMFFDSLPNQKFWEQEMSNGERQRVFKQSGRQHSDGAARSSPQQPDAAIFESLALANSGMVVTVHLPVAALHLAKADYDLVMFLYAIYGEVMEPASEGALAQESGDGAVADPSGADAAHTFAHTVLPQSMYHSTLSAQEEGDQVDADAMARSLYRHPPSSSFHAGMHAGDDDDGLPGSLSRSDSFSSDSSSEMFESVVGADSVILASSPQSKPHAKAGAHGHRPKFPHGSSTFSPQRGAGPMSGSLLKPQSSLVLQPAESSRASRQSNAPLTMDSLDQEEHKGGEMEEEDAESSDGDEPQFQPTVQSSRSASPDRFTPVQRNADHVESNLSDASDDESMPGDSIDGSTVHESQLLASQQGDEHKHISFGNDILLPARSALSASADLEQSETESNASGSSSGEINPAAIFDRASRTSGRSQLFQPAMSLSGLLPPVSDLLHPSTLASSSHIHSATSSMRSSMMDSRDDGNPAMFHSFLPPPADGFDAHASMSADASVDYSHLPPHPEPASRAQQRPPIAGHMQPPAPQQQQPQPLTAQSLAQLQSSVAPGPRPAPARGNVPFPITSASAFPIPPVSAAAGAFSAPTLSPVRPRSFYRHFMSLRLNIQRASLVLQEDPARASNAAHSAAAASSSSAPASSSSSAASSPPQSFHIDIGEVRLFQVVEYNGTPTAYIAVRAGDLTLREYKEAILDERQLFVAPSMPILFKTMGDQRETAAPNGQPNVDAWGQPLDLERKYDDEADEAAAGPLASVIGGGGGGGGSSVRHAFEASSSAWRNPVLLVNVVIKLDTQLNLRDTQAVINLRALTLQFDPVSEWIQHLMAFFMPTVHAPPTLPPAFNVAAPARPPPLPLTKDLLHLHLHGYDVSIDYNPVGIDPRAVVSIDHVHLSTTVFPDSALSELKIEVRDVAVFMTPYSTKARPASTRLLSELPQPFLHRVAASSLFQQLELLGYARLATLDVLDVVVRQNAPATSAPAAAGVRPVPELDVTVSNGLLSVLTCADSFQVLLAVCMHFVESVQQVQQVAEIDVQFDDGEVQSLSLDRPKQPASAAYQITQSAPVNSQTSGGFQANAFSTVSRQRAAYLLDDDEEEGAAEAEESKQTGPLAPGRNILDELDHNAFGADLGVAHVYSGSTDELQLQLNDNYQHEVSTKTSLSLALQAAAEREIERARREALGANEGANHFSNTSPPRAQHANTFAAAAAAGSAAPSQDQQAKWLTARESDELFQKDRHEDFIASLPDEDARLHEAELAREREERRRRRDEEAQKKDGPLRDAKEQRVAPSVIDDHVPLADDDTRTGRARLRPPPDYPHSVTQFMLLNLSVCWRMFGGQDWDMTRVNPSSPATSASASASAPPVAGRFATSSSSASSHLSPDDLPEVHNSAMGTVDIDDFYSRTEPFVSKTPQASFAPLSYPHPRMTTIPLPSDPYSGGYRASSSVVLESYAHRPTVEGSISSSPLLDVIPRGSRQTDRVMEVVIRGVNVRHDQYPSGVQIASRVVIALDDIEVHDLITTSPFNNFLCYYHRPGSKGRQLGSSMLRLDMTSVRPDPTRQREELRVKLSVLPLRLNVDQDAVEFFVHFFTHAPMSQSEAEGRDAVTFMQSAGDAPAGARFHELYRDVEAALTVAQNEVLAALVKLIQRGGAGGGASSFSALHSFNVDVETARLLCKNLVDEKLVRNETLAESVLGYSQKHFAEWRNGHGHDSSVGVATAQLLNRLLRIARASDGVADDSDDDEDDELAAGMGTGRTPMRRHSTDPLESFQFPAMPSDWIPVDFARNHANLVPTLHEAYHKYYDTIHSSMPDTPSSAIPAWRPPAGLLTLSVAESANEYRTRLLGLARTAARNQIKMLGAAAVREVDSQTYIQSFQVVSKIILCIDWKPNTFDLQGLRAGDYAQLANLLPLENMELELKGVKMMGMSGFDRVGMELAQLWAHDLSRHQAHRYLAGVQPIRSIVNVGSGVADLVLLPLSHYKQHGSIKRGVQRGLSSFLKNVSLESMTAAARLAQGAQSILESVDDVLTYRPAPLPSHAHAQFAQQRARTQARRAGRAGSVDMSSDAGAGSGAVDSRRKPTHISKRANPPASAHDGFRQAYESLSRGLQSAASQMIVVPRAEYQKYGSKGAVTSAIKAVPGAVLSPVIGGLQAVAQVFDGITNSIDPRRRTEISDKFKHTAPNS